MDPVENTALASRLMGKIFKLSIIIRLREFKERRNRTTLDLLDFLLKFSEKLPFFHLFINHVFCIASFKKP